MAAYDQDGLRRAIDSGSLIMNQVFVKRLPKQRLAKTSIRLSYFDMAIIFVTTVAMVALMFTIALLVTSIPGTGYSQKLGFRVLFTVIAIPLGIVVGHFLSKFSPYKKTTGESLGQWLSVQFERRYLVVDWLFGRRYMKERAITWVDGEPIEVDCHVYVGSARAPKTKKPPLKRVNGDEMYEVIFMPRTVQTDWVSRKMARKNAIRRLRAMSAKQS